MIVSERLLYQCVISIHENIGLEESRLDNEEVNKKKKNKFGSSRLDCNAITIEEQKTNFFQNDRCIICLCRLAHMHRIVPFHLSFFLCYS